MERDVTGAGPECVLPSPLQDLNLKVTVMDELVGEVSLMGLPGSAAVSMGPGRPGASHGDLGSSWA